MVQSPCLGDVIVIGTLARQSTVKPRQIFEGVVYLKNTEAQVTEAKIYQTDYLYSADGRTDYAEPGKNPRSNASWLTISPSQIKIAPNQTVTIRYKGQVPDKRDLRGTFWSMIMVEPNRPPAPIIQGKENEATLGIATAIRFGIQISTDVGNSGERNLRVLEKSLIKKEGKSHLQLDIENPGEHLMIPTISVELFDSKGASIGHFDGGHPRIYPACSIRSQVDLGDVPSGKYTAMVLLDNGDEHVMGAQYVLELGP